ncbi:hypothetical protein [Anaerophilus nitritogenes]|uniref:hypothetical protein n=1 Tax=Anaerophilus nitritogenes TaxID=2498136 RepID=UPI00101C88EB|nr:hypothetical protein [Anaerophilus nitritogenes]
MRPSVSISYHLRDTENPKIELSEERESELNGEKYRVLRFEGIDIFLTTEQAEKIDSEIFTRLQKEKWANNKGVKR